MKKKHYEVERQGQIEFFDNYRIDYQGDNSILVDNTDGIYHGNIMEFKLNISNTGKVLFQAIKYLSRMRIKGESVPARILLVDLNDTKVYVYNSKNYIDDIQKVYVGAASVGDDAFSRNVTPVAVYDYMDMSDSAEVLKMLINKPEKGETETEKWYIPIDIDENCIVGWAERYYREIPKATKGDFLGDGTGKINLTGEIRDPKHFEGLINPYTSDTNEKFVYLMDCLNSRLAKKDLGAFYTPMPYARKAAELVQKAVERVPDGNDYIILDRCAGTGNLESALIGLTDKNGSDLISHCVVSTYEYYEYKVLLERIGDKVRNIIPPTEANVVFENGNVSNADAMSEEYINNPLIKKYVDDEHCTIILFENPPYQNSSAITFTDDGHTRAHTQRADSFVLQQFRGIISTLNEQRGAATEFSNLFIWSGMNYYLRQKTDSMVILSPVKYFKSTWLVRKQFLGGFIFNRKWFHATDSCISCCLWANIEDQNTDHWNLEGFAIEDNKLHSIGTVRIGRVSKGLSVFNDMRSFDSDVITNVACEQNGEPIVYSAKKGRKPIYNENIIGYLVAITFTPDVKNYNLVRCNVKRGLQKSFGFHLRKDNYLKKLPLWCCKLFPQDEWYEKDIYFNTSDGGDAYTHDPEFLKECLIYTCLSNQNKCLTFTGSDGRFYRNELCLDTTNSDTCASADLKKYAADKKTALDDDEKALMKMWDQILEEAKKIKAVPKTPADGTRKDGSLDHAKYDPDITYGVYQITKELNTMYTTGSGSRKKNVYDHPVLNGYLTTLRDMLKAYYKSHITDKMFEYELLK